MKKEKGFGCMTKALGILLLLTLLGSGAVLFELSQKEFLEPAVELRLLSGIMKELPDGGGFTIDDLPGITFPTNTLAISYQRVDSRDDESIFFAFYVPAGGNVSLESFGYVDEWMRDGKLDGEPRKYIKNDMRYYYHGISRRNAVNAIPKFSFKDVKAYTTYLEDINGLDLSVRVLVTGKGTFVYGNRMMAFWN